MAQLRVERIDTRAGAYTGCDDCKRYAQWQVTLIVKKSKAILNLCGPHHSTKLPAMRERLALARGM